MVEGNASGGNFQENMVAGGAFEVQAAHLR
jgi:hypothetical protein